MMQKQPEKNTAISDLFVLWDIFKEAIDSFLQLVKIEAKEAQKSLKKILGLLLLKILLVATGWILLMVSLVFYIAALGKITLTLSFFLVGLLNVIAVLITSALIKRHYQKLSFPATRRQLQANFKKTMSN
jgi:uncharacterized membrane protein YqjE